jgi:hypothetical protein
VKYLNVKKIKIQRQNVLPGRLNTSSYEYHRISAKGKGGKVAVVAVARELLGFIWAIACAIEDKQVSESNVA